MGKGGRHPLKEAGQRKESFGGVGQVVFKGCALPFLANIEAKTAQRIEEVCFLQGFDRTIFSRQIYEMEVEFLAIIDGGGAVDSVFLSGLVQSNLGKDSLVLATFLSGESCFSVGGEALVFCQPNCSSSLWAVY